MLYQIANVVKEYFKVVKLLTASIACLLLVANAATAQNGNATSPESVTLPTLEEVKAAGVLRSNFRKHANRDP